MTPTRSAAAYGHHEAPTLSGRQTASARRPRVLVVDDDPDARNNYSASLAHLGYQAAAEICGEQGVEAALRTAPDAILMDVAMPGIGGIEATRRIKADARTRRCLVIAVTAHGTSMFSEARNAGCDAYFCKPFNAFALDKILGVLATSQARRPFRPTQNEVVKRCACGREYTRGAWLGLPLCGRMHAPRSGLVVELRNCACGSSIVLPAEGAFGAGGQG